MQAQGYAVTLLHIRNVLSGAYSGSLADHALHRFKRDFVAFVGRDCHHTTVHHKSDKTDHPGHRSANLGAAGGQV
jgi:hypothetical protein